MLTGALVFMLTHTSLGSGASPGQAIRNNDADRCVDWIRSHQIPPPRNSALTRVLSPETTCFDGDLFRWTTGKLTSWLSESKKEGVKSLHLVVRSMGGDAGAAIELAEKLQQHNVTVTFVDYCFSSCANYLFGGISQRRLVDYPVVLFHGGFSAAGRIKFVASLERNLIDPKIAGYIKDKEVWRSKQIKYYDKGLTGQNLLYARVGTNPKVSTEIDSVNLSSIPVERCGGTVGVKRDMLFFSIVQLHQLGITFEQGVPETDPIKINNRLSSLGISTAACAVPESFIGR